jgi:septum site-determining protein MinD
MGKALAFHSYKGGSGKTSISANIAVMLALKGFNVCILDYDFRAPSQYIIFKAKPNHWIGDYLEGKLEIEETLVDLSKEFSTKGKLLGGFADPSTDAMREMMSKGRKWETKALHQTLLAKDKITRDMGVDYLILDTSPGMLFSAANALAVADLIVVVSKADEFDTEGTKRMIKGMYEVLDKETGMIVNRILGTEIYAPEAAEKLKAGLEKEFNLPVLGIIPCLCQVQPARGLGILATSQPSHIFVQRLTGITKEIERLCNQGREVAKHA